MLCQDIMRRPVQHTAIEETAQVAAQRMRDAEIGFLPVCDEDGRVIGVVTDRDLAVRVVAEGKRPDKIRVGKIMTKAPIVCRPIDEIRRAQELMTMYRKSRIVVTDEDHKLLGVISLSDIAARGEPFAAETLRDVARRESVLDEHGLTRH